MFAEAVADGAYERRSPDDAPPAYELPQPRARTCALPPSLDPGISALARGQVRGLATDFETGPGPGGLLPRARGRSATRCRSTPGHGATDLAAWLLDPGQPQLPHRLLRAVRHRHGGDGPPGGDAQPGGAGLRPGRLLEDGRVVVLDRNAHAWVELWMPSQGWVRFDPTPARRRGQPGHLRTASPSTSPTTSTSRSPSSLPRQHPPILAAHRRADEDLDSPAPAPGARRRRLPAVPAWLVITGRWPSGRPSGLLPAVKWARRRRRLRALSTGRRRGSLAGDSRPPHRPRRRAARAADPGGGGRGHRPGPGPAGLVYGESIYGPPTETAFDLGRVAVAARSLAGRPRSSLAGRYSRARRLLARYRLRSLDPAAGAAGAARPARPASDAPGREARGPGAPSCPASAPMSSSTRRSISRNCSRSSSKRVHVLGDLVGDLADGHEEGQLPVAQGVDQFVVVGGDAEDAEPVGDQPAPRRGAGPCRRCAAGSPRPGAPAARDMPLSSRLLTTRRATRSRKAYSRRRPGTPPGALQGGPHKLTRSQ